MGTGENFLKVLSGDASAPGPVLKSTSSDHVFVYYADHGGVGILGVPTGAKGGYIHAADINKAIETLQSKGGYKELLFYLEACESGSIFNKLLKAPNAKAVTAANPKESSWGWYCPGDKKTGGDKVDGKEIGSCLGDEFSVRWMEDTDSASIASETVGQQFEKVQKEVTKSHVQQYGVTSFDSEPIGDFQGTTSQLSTGLSPISSEEDGVDSRLVEVHQAYYKVKRAKTPAEREAAKAGDMLESDIDALKDVTCHQNLLEAAAVRCGPFDGYSMRYSRLFANLCANGVAEQDVITAISSSCSTSVVV